MSELILRFHDETLDAFDWLVVKEGEISSDTQWSRSEESALAELMSDHNLPVIFVIPQQCVLMTHFILPGKASRQVLSSIEFQIEDQLGEDIELQHFATGDISDNRVPILVIKKSIMQRCQVLQLNHGITLSRIIPELFLCPWSGNEGEVSLIESQDGVILRFGYYQGFKCRLVLLKALLDQLNQSLPVKRVTYFFADSAAYETARIEGYDSQCCDPSLSHLADTNIASFDLRQREFKRSSVWAGVIKPWKWVAAVFIVFLVVIGFNKFDHLSELESQLADIKNRQYQLLKAHLPAGTTENDNLKKKLIQLLKQNKTSVADNDFLSQLDIFTQAKQKYASVFISKINFQKSRLSIDISSNKLNDVEALVKLLEASPLSAKLENLTIKPEFISGRLILGGQ